MTIILVVEDDPVIAGMLEAFLEDDGYAVAVAANGQETPARVDQVQSQLPVSDISMPARDGLTLCQRLKQQPRYHTLPIVLISAVMELPVQAEAGYQVFLPKPLDMYELLRTVAFLVRGG